MQEWWNQAGQYLYMLLSIRVHTTLTVVHAEMYSMLVVQILWRDLCEWHHMAMDSL